jgi:hypothetical protein
LLQFFDVAPDFFDEPIHAAVGVIERGPGKGADMGHGDDDFGSRAEEIEGHRSFLFDLEVDLSGR